MTWPSPWRLLGYALVLFAGIWLIERAGNVLTNLLPSMDSPALTEANRQLSHHQALKVTLARMQKAQDSLTTLAEVEGQAVRVRILNTPPAPAGNLPAIRWQGIALAADTAIGHCQAALVICRQQNDSLRLDTDSLSHALDELKKQKPRRCGLAAGLGVAVGKQVTPGLFVGLGCLF